jgi:UDPglucose 6-dehydrogenase
MVKLAVVGYGYVGRAVVASFEEIYDLHVVDPKHNNNSLSDELVDGVIVCVGTPANNDGTCDSSAIETVFEQINYTTPVLIKSTMALQNFLQLQQKYPNHQITLSPEFLRGDHAVEDFAAQQFVILGGGNTEFWSKIFGRRFPRIQYHVCTHREAILIKYAENSFLAIKVGFFNHIRELSELAGADFETVRHLLTQDQRIGPDHSYTPGPDGAVGWGGHCLPKDTSAILHTAQSLNYKFDILSAAVEYNRRIRG